jgi:hypothetical protein
MRPSVAVAIRRAREVEEDRIDLFAALAQTQSRVSRYSAMNAWPISSAATQKASDVQDTWVSSP